MNTLDWFLRIIYSFLDQESETYQYFENIDEGYGMFWGFIILMGISFITAFAFYYVWVGINAHNGTRKKWIISGLIGEIVLIISLYGFIGGKIAEMSIDELFFQNLNLFVLFNVLYFIVTYYLLSLAVRIWSKAKYVPQNIFLQISDTFNKNK